MQQGRRAIVSVSPLHNSLSPVELCHRPPNYSTSGLSHNERSVPPQHMYLDLSFQLDLYWQPNSTRSPLHSGTYAVMRPAGHKADHAPATFARDQDATFFRPLPGGIGLDALIVSHAWREFGSEFDQIRYFWSNPQVCLSLEGRIRNFIPIQSNLNKSRISHNFRGFPWHTGQSVPGVQVFTGATRLIGARRSSL